MAKRKLQKDGPVGRRVPVSPLDSDTIKEIVALLDGGRPVEAIMILEELRHDHPRDATIYKFLGMGYAQVGELGGAAEAWEEASRLDTDDPSLWRVLAGVYQAQGRLVHAVRALRRYLAAEPAGEDLAEVEGLRRRIEEALAEIGHTFGVSPAEAERGTLLLERGLRAMEEGDFLGATRHFRDAARALPGWTVPQNNLALCQFELGNGDAALATVERTLASAPNDAQALANLVRFLVILGRREEALAYGERLWTLSQEAIAAAPTDGEGAVARFEFEKAAGAYMLLEQDERVVASLERRPREALSDYGLSLLGAALANTGRKTTALEVFGALEPDPVAARLAEALRLNETPPGRRFPGVEPAELLPAAIAGQLAREIDRINAQGADDEARGAAIEALLARAPTFLPAFAASLWLEDEIASSRAVAVLLGVGTPAAIDAVRVFAFGRLGPDETRLHAALALLRAGRVESSVNRPLLLWQDGRYQELRPPRYEIGDEEAGAKRPYPPAIGKQMAKALERHTKGDYAGAARLYRQVLAQDATIEDAEQHLGLIELLNGDLVAAEGHFSRALELDPAFALPRCTLASLRIRQGRLAEARDLLTPLADRTRFGGTELASYLFTTAELARADGDEARARAHLRLLLAYLPTHTPARLRLRELERAETERQEAQGPNRGQLLQPASGLWPFGSRKE